jgi:hypothetical protein
VAKKKNPVLFSTLDFYGNLVKLPEKSWVGHILTEHPEMSGYHDLLREVIKDPAEIRVSSYVTTGVAFISTPGVGPRPLGLRVLVNYADEFYEKGSSTGDVTTAYPIDIIKYGNPQLGRTIYKKGSQS